MEAVRKRLTYANVVASLALFLALGGGAVWAAGKVGSKGLKANAVTAGKIKRNAVTNSKIRGNAVTAPKLKNGAVTFPKLAAGTSLIGTASGGPVAANGTGPVAVPLSGMVTFTPATGTAAFLSVEAKGNDLGRLGEEPCEPRVVPFVNGSAWDPTDRGLVRPSATPNARRPRPSRPRSRSPRRSSHPQWNGQGRNRTGDTTIFSRVLYQLSYLARAARNRIGVEVPGC